MLNHLGWGTEAWGNNTAVTPALPTGLQDGDILLLYTFIRENGASPLAPSGWSVGGGYSAATPECTEVIFWRYYTSGVTAPTVSFSGGGSNDTTFAQIAALRSTTGASVTISSVGANESAGTALGSAVTTPIFKSTDMVLYCASLQNDAPSTTAAISWYDNNASATARYTDQRVYYSVLGSDATVICGLTAPNFNPTSGQSDYVRFDTGWDGVSTGSHISWVRVTELLLVNHIPTGGASAGGTAPHTFVPIGTFDAPQPTGGASAGGAAVVEVVTPGLRQIKASAKGSAQSTSSLTVSWDSSGLDADSLLILQVSTASNGNPTPVTPSGWTKISSGTSNDSSVYWRRYQSGDPTSVTVTFTTDDSTSAKAGLVNFFKNTDWSKNGGNPFGPEYRTSGVGGGYLGFPIATTTPTAILSLRGITSNAGTYLVVGGETWIDLEKSGASWTYYCECRAALIPLTTSTRASNTQAQSFYSATNAGHEANTYSINVLQEGGPTDYAYTASGGASVGGAATTIPPATPADYPWTASGGMVLGGLSATISFNPGPEPRNLIGLTLSWPTVRRLIGADRTSFSLRLGVTTLRLRALRITRALDAGNSIEAVVMSPHAPVAVAQELVAAMTTFSGSGQVLNERLWTVTVNRVVELDDSQAWSVRATETTLRGGGLAWAPARVSLRTSSGARAAPDFNVVAGDTYNGRVIGRVTTFLQATGAGSTEVSYG